MIQFIGYINILIDVKDQNYKEIKKSKKKRLNNKKSKK